MNIVHTMASEARTPKRRYYSPELKLQVVAACARANASMARVAMQYGVNANIVHRWLREHSQGTLVAQPPAFVPVTLQSSTEVAAPAAGAQATGEIRMELRRGSATVTVTWPSQLAGECGVWLREWLR
jgi:transposase-like protein